MIGDVEFAVMKPTAVVINVGRGAVIDEAALLGALTAK
jgi:D-3-phosphoglycerate dehydrogenase / 2-oxoglutarate reductase